MLTLGWSDGVTFLPVNSCLLSSEKESSRINEGWDVDSNYNGAKARKSATKKATEVIPELISDAIKAGIQANYVLFDSWFSSPPTAGGIYHPERGDLRAGHGFLCGFAC